MKAVIKCCDSYDMYRQNLQQILHVNFDATAGRLFDAPVHLLDSFINTLFHAPNILDAKHGRHQTFTLGMAFLLCGQLVWDAVDRFVSFGRRLLTLAGPPHGLYA